MPTSGCFDERDYDPVDAILASSDASPADNLELEQPAIERHPQSQPFGLPAQPTPLLGRDELVARLTEDLDAAERRLLTLTGPGGVGKTRLACEVARRSQRRHEIVRFVDLTQIATSADFVPLVNQALAPTRMIDSAASEQNLIMLSNQRTLLLLDNFEHILDAAPYVAELLANTPWLQIIATSRMALHLRWEHICHVPPLESPPVGTRISAEKLATVPSVALFTEFAQRLQPNFSVTAGNAQTIIEICRRLDGLPLALELAAADLREMPLERLLERLDQPLHSLVRGPRDLPQRQQTIRATIEWSYALLTPEEQRTVRHLAIFAGGGNISAVTEIVQPSGDAMYDKLIDIARHQLIDIVEQDQTEPRFQMSHIVHHYLIEQLSDDDEFDALYERFSRYFIQVATSYSSQLSGATAAAALQVLSAGADNFQRIFEHASERPDDGRGIQLALTLTPFWLSQGQLPAGRYWLERLAAFASDGILELRVAARLAAVRLAVIAGDLATAQRLLDATRSDCDRPELSEARARFLLWSCYVKVLRGDVGAASALLDTALELRDTPVVINGAMGVISATYLRALIAIEGGDDNAPALLAKALNDIDPAADPQDTIDILCTQAELALDASHPGEAARLFSKVLVRAQVDGNQRARMRALIGLGDIAADQLSTDEALHHFHDALGIARDNDDERAIIQILERMAILGVSSRIVPSMLRIIGLAETMRKRLDVGRLRFVDRRITPKLHHAREMLGDDEFNRIRTDGEALTLLDIAKMFEAEASAKRALSRPVSNRGKRSPSTIEQLTRREREVVQQIANGHPNRQIAANLGIAERTVDTHIANIRQKLQLPSRARLAVWAVANGLSSAD